MEKLPRIRGVWPNACIHFVGSRESLQQDEIWVKHWAHFVIETAQHTSVRCSPEVHTAANMKKEYTHYSIE